jgi:HEAT repeat protein
VQRGVVLGALGHAGTEEAQQTLLDVMQDGALTSETRVHAGIAMMLVEHPNANVIDALRAGLRTPDADLRATAGLALGAFAGRLGDTALVDDLLAELAAARDPQRVIELLAALGNARDTRALPAIRTALGSSLASVRRAAVTALRGFASAEAQTLVARVLVQDSDALVRKAAAQAAAFLELRDALSAALANEADDNVRAAIEEALATLS